MLVLDLNCPVVNEEAKEERKKILLDYFSENLNRHNFYAFRFFICEALNFVNVFVQIYFMDYFLGGEFSTYGSDVLSFTEMEPEERADPMSRVFPKVTKCTFHKYGPSGSVQKFDGEFFDFSHLIVKLWKLFSICWTFLNIFSSNVMSDGSITDLIHNHIHVVYYLAIMFLCGSSLYLNYSISNTLRWIKNYEWSCW